MLKPYYQQIRTRIPNNICPVCGKRTVGGMSLVNKNKVLKSFGSRDELNISELKAYEKIEKNHKDFIYVCDEHLKPNMIKKLIIEKINLQKQQQYRSAAYVQKRIDKLKKSNKLIVL